MLVQRQRRWVNVNVTLAQRLLFAESVTHALLVGRIMAQNR